MKTNKEYMQDETASRIEVMEAYIEGAAIESTPIPVPGDSTTNIDWQPEEMPTWDWQHRHYRIKQEIPKEILKENIPTCWEYITDKINVDDSKDTGWIWFADYIDKYLATDECRQANWAILKENVNKMFDMIADLRKDNEDLRTEIDRLRKDVDAMPKTTLVPYLPYSPYVGDAPQPYVFPQVWYSTSTGSLKGTDAYTAERQK